MKKVLLLTLIALLCGCSLGKKESKEVETIVADFRTAQEPFDLANLMEGELEVIPLETKEGALIGVIQDVRVTENRIFVTDEMSRKIVIFDRQGRYVSQINKFGRGPQEYLAIQTTEVLNDSTVIVYDHFSRKCNIYSDSGRLKDKIDISKIWAFNVVSMDDDLYFINAGSEAEAGYYQLYKRQKNSEEFEMLLPFDKEIVDKQIGWGLESYHSKNNDEMILFFPPYDTIYMASSKEAYPKFFVDFGSRKIPNSVINTGSNALITAIAALYITGIDRAFLTDTHIFIKFSERDDYIAIYDRKTKECKVYTEAINSLYPKLPQLSENNVLRDKTLIKYLNANEIKVHFDDTSSENKFTQKMIALRNSLSDTDNPVIFIQKFK